jgi:hypothetical protein
MCCRPLECSLIDAARCTTVCLQEYLDFASYLLNLSYSSYDLTQHLDGQPLQVIST